MRQSVVSIIFAAALIFETYALAVAIPMIKNDDGGSMEQGTLTSLLSEEMADDAFVGADPAAGRRHDGPKVIVVADANLWKNLRVLDRGLSLYRQRAGENGLTLDRREVGQDGSIAIIKKDTMRCMVGRVYRPCWEV